MAAPELAAPRGAGLAVLRAFVADLSRLAEHGDAEALAAQARPLLAQLIARDDWLPDAFAQPSPERYQQYLLHCDPLERFSVVSFVWGSGQSTPVHDHGVWGLVGVLRGAELSQRYDARGRPLGARERLEPGDVDVLSPSEGDVHRVWNAFDDRTSISIHVYGANIGAVRRATLDEDGLRKPFVSGYANAVLPNLWDRSAEVREAAA